MSQPPIDLLPQAVRARSMAGVVIGRYVAAMLLAAAFIVGPALLAQVERTLARQERQREEECVRNVIRREQALRELQLQVEEQVNQNRSYDKLSLPVSISRVIATIVNVMPPPLTLERLGLRVHGEPRPAQAPAAAAARTRAEPPDASGRLVLVGELGGFAPDDIGAADYVTALRRLGLCESVKLEHVQARAKPVRGRTARDFRISFRIDLDRRYQVVERPAGDAAGAAAEVRRVE